MTRKQRNGPAEAGPRAPSNQNPTMAPDESTCVVASVPSVSDYRQRRSRRAECAAIQTRAPAHRWRWAGREWQPQRFGLDDDELQRELLRMLDGGWTLDEARAVLVMPRW